MYSGVARRRKVGGTNIFSRKVKSKKKKRSQRRKSLKAPDRVYVYRGRALSSNAIFIKIFGCEIVLKGGSGSSPRNVLQD